VIDAYGPAPGCQRNRRRDRDDGLDSPIAVRRLVFDCFSPRSLASFYEGPLGMDRRLEETAERVVLSLGDRRFPDFGFQHARFVAGRWPEPAYPAQLHVDLRFEDGTAAAVRRADAFGTDPPAQAGGRRDLCRSRRAPLLPVM